MTVAGKPQKYVELKLETGPNNQVKVVTPSQHVMVLPIDQAVAACKAFANQQLFSAQFNQMLTHLGQWVDKNKSKIEQAFVSPRDAGLLFLVVQQSATYDESFEDLMTELDLEIANDDDYNLINLSVLAIPPCEEETTQSFLDNNSIKYKI